MEKHGKTCVLLLNGLLRTLIRSQCMRLIKHSGGKLLEILNTPTENSINKVIDDVLTEVFGRKATLYIYKYLEATYELYPNQFSGKLDLFSKGLEDCLSSGAITVQTRIVNALSLM